MAYTDLKTTRLTARYGVEIHDVDLREVATGKGFADIREAFDRDSALLFRNQTIAPDDHRKLAELFGPLEDRNADERKPGETWEIPQVSNVLKDGRVSGEMDLHTLNLKSNQLWHTDSIFLPLPALVNILIARVVTETGGGTEIASTREAWRDMPAELKAKVEGKGLWHRYSNSRRKISEELAKLPMFTKWPDTHWKALWRNPVTGEDALYLASHTVRIDGMSEAESEPIIDELVAFCTRPEYVYAHQWQVGDVLIWDERATLHRGQAWDYSKPRTLSSICCSVRESDGFPSMRMTAA
jgi:alpha-ketoglutarate-dependent 2,4-dichlorophenoxyacetate dioxygenase